MKSKQAPLDYTLTWDLTEEALKAGQELVAARLRPNVGWHRRVQGDAEHRYFRALNEYAAAHAAGADPQVWQNADQTKGAVVDRDDELELLARRVGALEPFEKLADDG
jgi:hypothetical protein